MLRFRVFCSIAAGLRRRKIAKTSLLQSLRVIEYFLAPALCLSVWTFFSMDIFCENEIFVKDFFGPADRKNLCSKRE